MKAVCSLLSTILLFFYFNATGQRRRADNAVLFDRYVQKGLVQWRTPGLSVVVVKDGKVVFRKGYGVQELGKPEPFGTGTLGLCASTTKAMTAVCMGMLVDEGKLSWNDKVRDLYPEFSLSDPAVSAEITVRDLFTHNTGLGNADNLWVYGYSREEIIRRMRFLPLAYSLRSSFIYQNLMYVVAGEVIHRVSGEPWESFIARRLFAPLGMDDTYASYALSEGKAGHETPHFIINDSIRPIINRNYPSVGPAGGVWSCADDMDKWMSFLLDSARVAGTRLLKPATWQELFKPVSMVTESEFYPTKRLTHPNWTTYGLGWFQEDYRGKMVQFHTGSLDGAVAILGLLPSERFGIYIFGNLDHTELRHALMYKAMDLWAFQDDSQDWSTAFHTMYAKMRENAAKRQKEKEGMRVTGTKPSLPLAAYVGAYTNEVYGHAAVSLTGDSLGILFPNDISLRLQHWNYDSFAGYYNYFWWDKEWVQFFLDGRGKVTGFEKDGVLYKLQPAAQHD